MLHFSLQKFLDLHVSFSSLVVTFNLDCGITLRLFFAISYEILYAVYTISFRVYFPFFSVVCVSFLSYFTFEIILSSL